MAPNNTFETQFPKPCDLNQSMIFQNRLQHNLKLARNLYERLVGQNFSFQKGSQFALELVQFPPNVLDDPSKLKQFLEEHIEALERQIESVQRFLARHGLK